MIHLPQDVALVCLSATVSNAEELADWITTVRGPTEAVIEERRPVELHNLYLVGDKSSPDLHLLPTLVDGRPNPEASRLDDEALRVRGTPSRGRPRRRFFTPRRVEVIERLQDEGMLPAITFIFSRNACDDARDACLDAGLRLTTPDERARIRAIVDERTAVLADADLDVLGFDRFLAGLEMGVAAHHAGMVPPFKEAVEACFTEGLTKAVFATETLALGVNMPARSVVIERLTKFSGERRELLTPGEYTQLTGRAGRRGIDEVGLRHRALVAVRALRAGGRPGLEPHLRAALGVPPHVQHGGEPRAPLPARRGPPPAQPVVRAVPGRQGGGAPRGPHRAPAHPPGAPARPRRRCERGDVEEYRQLRAAAQRSRTAPAPPAVVARSTAPSPRSAGSRPATSSCSTAPRSRCSAWRSARATRACTWSTSGASRGRSAPTSCPSRRTRSAPSSCPSRTTRTTAPSSTRWGRRCAGRGSAATACEVDEADDRRRGVPRRRGASGGRLPRPGCPRAQRGPGRAGRPASSTTSSRQVQGRTGSLARQFDRVLRLLEAWGYLDGWSLTASGEVLARTYHESDLLVAEAMTTGLLDDLDVPSLAALVSCFTYEHRGRDRPPEPALPVVDGAHPLRGAPADRRRPGRRRGDGRALAPRARPMPGSSTWPTRGRPATAWPTVLEDEELSGGDFVRNVKQLIDLLRGIGDVAPVAGHRRAGPPGRRRAPPRRGDRQLRGRGRRHRRGVGCRSRRVRPGASPARCRATAWSCAPTPRRARSSPRPPRRRADPAARAPRRRPVPHARRHGRRGPAALRRGHAAARRPRRGPGRRPAALVRGPPRRPARAGGAAGSWRR